LLRRAAGATAMFGERYDDVVRVVEVPGVSMELCGGEAGEEGAEGRRLGLPVAAVTGGGVLGGQTEQHDHPRAARANMMRKLLLLLPPASGTHVSNTSEIGAFKVISEGGVASGVRRIEAVAGQAAVEYLQAVDGVVRALASSLKVKGEDVPARVAALQVSWRWGWWGRNGLALWTMCIGWWWVGGGCVSLRWGSVLTAVSWLHPLLWLSVMAAAPAARH